MLLIYLRYSRLQDRINQFFFDKFTAPSLVKVHDEQEEFLNVPMAGITLHKFAFSCIINTDSKLLEFLENQKPISFIVRLRVR